MNLRLTLSCTVFSLLCFTASAHSQCDLDHVEVVDRVVRGMDATGAALWEKDYGVGTYLGAKLVNDGTRSGVLVLSQMRGTLSSTLTLLDCSGVARSEIPVDTGICGIPELSSHMSAFEVTEVSALGIADVRILIQSFAYSKATVLRTFTTDLGRMTLQDSGALFLVDTSIARRVFLVPVGEATHLIVMQEAATMDPPLARGRYAVASYRLPSVPVAGCDSLSATWQVSRAVDPGSVNRVVLAAPDTLKVTTATFNFGLAVESGRVLDVSTKVTSVSGNWYSSNSSVFNGRDSAGTRVWYTALSGGRFVGAVQAQFEGLPVWILLPADADGSAQAMDLGGNVLGLVNIPVPTFPASSRGVSRSRLDDSGSQLEVVLVTDEGLGGPSVRLEKVSVQAPAVDLGSMAVQPILNWSREFDGIDLPRTRQLTDFRFGSDKIRAREYFTRWLPYEFDLETGDCLVPTWLGDPRIDDVANVVQGIDRLGNVVWQRTLDSRVRLATRQSDIIYGWRLTLILEGSEGQNASILTLNDRGETFRELSFPTNLDGSPSRVALAFEVPQSRGRAVIGIVPSSQGGDSPMFATPVRFEPFLAQMAPFHGELEWGRGIPKIAVLAGGARNGRPRVELRSVMRSWAFQAAADYDFDGSDIFHTAWDSALSFVDSPDPSDLVGLADLAGNTVRLTAVYSNSYLPPKIEIARRRYAGVRTHGSTVEWLNRDGSVSEALVFDDSVLDAISEDGYSAVLTQSSEGPKISMVGTFEGSSPLLVETVDLWQDGTIPPRVTHFVDRSPDLVSGEDFVYVRDLLSIPAGPQFHHRGPAFRKIRLWNRLIISGRSRSVQRPEMIGFPLEYPENAAAGSELTPIWTTTFDGSVPGIPSKKRVANALPHGTRVRVYFNDGSRLLLNDAGRAVPVGILASWWGPGRQDLDGRYLMERGDEFGVEFRLFSAAGLRNSFLEFLTDDSRLEILDVTSLNDVMATATRDSGIVHIEQHGADGYDFSDGGRSVSFIRLRVRSDAPEGIVDLALDAEKSKLLRSDGSAMPFTTRFTRDESPLSITIPCAGPDLDGVSPLTANDVVVLLRQIVGLTQVSASQVCWADADANGEIDLADAIRMLRQIVGLAKVSPPQSVSSAPEWGIVESGPGYLVLTLSGVESAVGFDLTVERYDSQDGPLTLEVLNEGLAVSRSGQGARIAWVTSDPVAPSIRLKGTRSGQLELRPGTAFLADGTRIEWPAQRFDLAPSDGSIAPLATRLEQNRPNPFNPSTEISYSLAREQEIELTVYDAAGRMVRHLDHGVQSAGSHVVTWRGDDDSGEAVASGVYWYRLMSSEGGEVRKMVLVR